MTETSERTIARLEARLTRLKANMLSGVTRPRIIAGAVAMAEARENRDFAKALLLAFDKGRDRMVDRQTIDPFVEELEDLWDLRDRDGRGPRALADDSGAADAARASRHGPT